MTRLQGARVTIVGLGKSGVAAARFAAARGARSLVLADTKGAAELGPALGSLRALGAETRFGPFTDATFADADVLVLSPGVAPQHPAIAAAAARGVRLTNETALALAELETPVIAVTGTSGKTTTTTLIGAMLTASGYSVFVGGNIGKPLAEHALSGMKLDFIVAELSSFQIELLAPFTPRVVVYMPIAEDHLDRHGTVAEYHRVKRRLAEMGDASTLVVVNEENPVHREFAKVTRSRVAWYGMHEPSARPAAWCDAEADRFEFRSGTLTTNGAARGASWPARGGVIVGGNRENLMAAALAAMDVGATVDAVGEVIAGFRGIAHRMEVVRVKEGVRWFNDSKATNVVAALNALSGFETRSVILIAGGKDKKIDFVPLRSAVERACKGVVLIGEARPRLAEALEGAAPLHIAASLDEAVHFAAMSASAGDNVVLAPACASQDMFRDYEDRGEQFRALVAGL